MTSLPWIPIIPGIPKFQRAQCSDMTSLPRIPIFPGIPEFQRGVQPQPHEVWRLSHISSQNSQISRNSGIPQGCAQPHLFPEFPYFPEFRNSTGVGSATSLPRIPIFPGIPEFHRSATPGTTLTQDDTHTVEFMLSPPHPFLARIFEGGGLSMIHTLYIFSIFMDS